MKNKKPPVIVNAPVIVSNSTPDVQPLLDLITSLKAHGAETVAAAEADRLAPYFRKMGSYLQQAIERSQVKAKPELLEPEKLSEIFNRVSAKTHNLLLSEVAIMPSDAYENEYLDEFIEHNQFSPRFYHNKHSICFGFLQVYQKNGAGKRASSITIPTLQLDSEMMATASRMAGKDALKSMLESLSPVMNMVNHDILHHFTLTTINPIVASPIDRKTSGWEVESWSQELQDYERWAHIMHENVLMHDGGQGVNAIVELNMHKYFDVLQAMQDKALADEKISPRNIRDCTDYFGMVMAHTLTRLYPLTSDMMDKCIKRMMQIDTIPEMLRNEKKDEADYNVAKVFNEYAIAGLPLKYTHNGAPPLPGAPIGLEEYKSIRYAQLAFISYEDAINHTPATEKLLKHYTRTFTLHNRIYAEDHAIGMVRAVDNDMKENKIERLTVKLREFIFE